MIRHIYYFSSKTRRNSWWRNHLNTHPISHPGHDHLSQDSELMIPDLSDPEPLDVDFDRSDAVDEAD